MGLKKGTGSGFSAADLPVAGLAVHPPTGPRSVTCAPSTQLGVSPLPQAEVSLRSWWFHTAMALLK